MKKLKTKIYIHSGLDEGNYIRFYRPNESESAPLTKGHLTLVNKCSSNYHTNPEDKLDFKKLTFLGEKLFVKNCCKLHDNIPKEREPPELTDKDLEEIINGALQNQLPIVAIDFLSANNWDDYPVGVHHDLISVKYFGER